MILDSSIEEMNCDVDIIGPESHQNWNEFILSHPHGSLYHHSSWINLIQTTYGYEPYILAIRNREKIYAGLPTFLVKSLFTGTRLVSLPFSDSCDPLTNNPEDYDFFLYKLIQMARNMKASRIRIKQIHSDFFPIDTDYSMKCDAINHVLSLDGTLDEVKIRFQKDYVMRNINRAEKNKIKIIKGNDEHHMYNFYILQVLTRHRHGLPSLPYKFFRNMWNLLYPRGMLEVLLAVYGGRLVAGIVVAICKDKMYYLYGGSNSHYAEYRPNYLLLWKAIKVAHSRNLKYFDFGRTSIKNQDLLNFKRKWGTEERQFIYISIDSKLTSRRSVSQKFNNYKYFSSIIRHMPSQFSRISGQLIYKHLG